jgi:NAD(P)-dependent dehydrogenase (short-subunit alcohol dehydrogenase family)
VAPGWAYGYNPPRENQFSPRVEDSRDKLQSLPAPRPDEAPTATDFSFKSIDDISDEGWELTFKVNMHAMFYLTKAAVPHMKPGRCIINTASINSDQPNLRC